MGCCSRLLRGVRQHLQRVDGALRQKLRTGQQDRAAREKARVVQPTVAAYAEQRAAASRIITDDSTSAKFVLGVEDGKLYIKEATR